MRYGMSLPRTPVGLGVCLAVRIGQHCCRRACCLMGLGRSPTNIRWLDVVRRAGKRTGACNVFPSASKGLSGKRFCGGLSRRPRLGTDVLLAVQMAQLSYVAPVREISMLVGTFIGASILKEAVKPSQVAVAGIMLFGVLGLVWA